MSTPTHPAYDAAAAAADNAPQGAQPANPLDAASYGAVHAGAGTPPRPVRNPGDGAPAWMHRKHIISFPERPIVVNGQEITQLELHEPTIGDLHYLRSLPECPSPDAPGGAFGFEVLLAAHLAGVPAETVRQLAAREWAKIETLFADFLGYGGGS